MIDLKWLHDLELPGRTFVLVEADDRGRQDVLQVDGLAVIWNGILLKLKAEIFFNWNFACKSNSQLIWKYMCWYSQFERLRDFFFTKDFFPSRHFSMTFFRIFILRHFSDESLIDNFLEILLLIKLFRRLTVRTRV